MSSKTPESARSRALRLLARREHGARELQYKLNQRGIDDDSAAEVVQELAQAGWQSDARYVCSLVRSRVAQGFGCLRIEAELEQAGVAATLVREALAAAEVDWKAQAVEVHARKFGHPPASAAEWQRQYRYLAGRGFDAEHIHRALRSEAPPEE